mmetsp:Transcript_58594/g.124347  ORF Transcript_58594/g.124347 Transcript_58594/m.124347 type:complete len:271 (+) Transcript_58594:414-1226(+)
MAFMLDTSSPSTARSLSPRQTSSYMGLSDLISLTYAAPPSGGESTITPSFPAGAMMSSCLGEIFSVSLASWVLSVSDDAEDRLSSSPTLDLMTAMLLSACLLFLASIIEISTAFLSDTSSPSMAITLSPRRSLPIMGLCSLISLTNAEPPRESTTTPNFPGGAMTLTLLSEPWLVPLRWLVLAFCACLGGGNTSSVLEESEEGDNTSGEDAPLSSLKMVIFLCGCLLFLARHIEISTAVFVDTSSPSMARTLSPSFISSFMGLVSLILLT